MITPSVEYWRTLYRIQDQNFPQFKTVGPLPESEPLYEVDFNTRQITAPKFIGVYHDQSAEIIYFKCARFVEGQDLTQTCCVIQYETAKGDKRLSPVRFYYAEVENSDTILIPWEITQGVTQYAGTVKFSLRFYIIEPDTASFRYSLNTMPATTTVLTGMDTTSNDNYNFDNSLIEQLLADIKNLQDNYEAGIYWVDVVTS